MNLDNTTFIDDFELTESVLPTTEVSQIKLKFWSTDKVTRHLGTPF